MKFEIKKKYAVVGVLLLIMTTIFAQENMEQETLMGNNQNIETIIPFKFSFMDSKNENLNPYANKTTNFHISIFSGRVGGVQGLQLGGISNYVKNDFIGYDGTGIYSEVGGNFAGVQNTGLVSIVKGRFTGVQDVGIYSFVGSDFLGVQATGIMNRVEGSFSGVQMSGIINETEDVLGVQMAGIINNAQDVEGVQMSGIVNNAKDVEGVQTSGIVNNADHVKGVQIGLINRSKKLDGIAIGLINLSESGNVYGVGWAGGASDYQAGIKFAPNDYWYTIISGGRMNGSAGKPDRHVIQSHMGIHYPFTSKFYIEADISSGAAMPMNFDNWDDEDNFDHIAEGRIAVGYKIGSRISIFGGISSYSIGDEDDFFAGGSSETKPFIGIQF